MTGAAGRQARVRAPSNPHPRIPPGRNHGNVAGEIGASLSSGGGDADLDRPAARHRGAARTTIRLLGPLQVRAEAGREIVLSGPRTQALLGYLALRLGRREHRDRLATLLWADRGQEQARHSLRQALLTLRRALAPAGADPVIADAQTVMLDPALVETDLARFETLAGSDEVPALREAAGLISGNLLDGLAVAAEPFSEWLEAERARLHAKAGDVLLRLAHAQAAEGDAPAAIAAAQRALDLDPALEEAHRLLMEIHRRAGNRAAALRQYQLCEAALRRELDAEPAPATRGLAEAIRSEDPPTPPAPPSAKPRPGMVANAPAPSPPRPGRRRTTPMLLGASGLVAAALVVAVDLAMPSLLHPTLAEPVAARPGFPLPDRPSIVVLPFRNGSGQAAHAALVDGITEEITAALTMVSGMFVIARTTALTYRDRPVDLREVADALGIRYVLDGAVQVEDGQVRVLATLSDAVANRLLWTHRQEERLDRVFRLNDAIALQVLTGLNVHLTEGEQERISLVHGTDNLQAWLLAGRALQLVRRFTPADNLAARQLYEAALALAPDYAGASSGLAWTYFVEARFGWAEDPAASLLRAATIAQRVLVGSPSHPASHALLGGVALARGRHAEAIRLAERAVALSPSGADVTAVLGLVLTYAGQPARAAETMQTAMRLSPYYPDWYRWTLGRAWRLAGDPARAIAALEAPNREAGPTVAPLVELAAAQVAAGRMDAAATTAGRVLALAPGFSVRAWLQVPPYLDPAEAERERTLLQQAGLPP